VITVVDGSGNKVSGQAENLAVTVGATNAGATVGVITQAADTTYTTSYTPTVAGTDDIAITFSGTPTRGCPYSSEVVAGAPAQYLVTSSRGTPNAGAAVTISAQLADANGNPVALAGRIVGWSSTNGGSFAAASTVTDADGVATVTFTTSTTPGTTHTVTADDGTVSGSSDGITTQ
jgi:hypothetical protein